MQTNLQTALDCFHKYRKDYNFGFSAHKAAKEAGIDLSELIVELSKHKPSKIKVKS